MSDAPTGLDLARDLQFKTAGFANLVALVDDNLDDEMQAWVASKAMARWDEVQAALAALELDLARLRRLAALHTADTPIPQPPQPGDATSTQSVASSAQTDATDEEAVASESGEAGTPLPAHPTPENAA